MDNRGSLGAVIKMWNLWIFGTDADTCTVTGSSIHGEKHKINQDSDGIKKISMQSETDKKWFYPKYWITYISKKNL